MTNSFLPLDDPRWQDLDGGYKQPYDASLPLRRMEAGEDVWEELWDELHHQGDLGTASYAAVPHLVRLARQKRDWNVYALVGLIETERHRKTNPSVPPWLLGHYQHAWEQLMQMALEDLSRPGEPILVQSALAVVAFGRRQTQLGAMLLQMDDSEISDWTEERLGWSEIYRKQLTD